MRILVAEDDALLGVAVQRALTRVGYAVDWVRTGAHFLLSTATHQYDFVVLDLGFPDASGEDLLQSLRSKKPNLPVIVITARGAVNDRVSLLDFGADDYLVKPFDLDELTARVRSVLRRVPTGDGNEGAFAHGPLQLYPKRHVATWDGREVSLTHREFWVLEALMRNRNQVLSRGQLEETLYGWGEEVDSNAIEVYVHYLRRKLGASLIQTIRGVGYQLAPLTEHA
ncbi:MAG: response regulator transcription factor [Caldimonas sp.]